MRIVVTGKSGQVVTALIERGPAAGAEILPIGRPELDLADPENAFELLAALAPDVIVSAAAYTAVDKAESEAELAYAVNARGPEGIAAAAARLNVPVIHISTDYVFDGSKTSPWLEDDKVAPLGVYGASKLAGEAAVLASGARAVILRTAWVYAPFGANFARTMLRLAENRDEVGVVADQIGAPTSALDIADAILKVARNLADHKDDPKLEGIFHLGASGPDASWADFAEAVFSGLAERGGKRVHVKRIGTVDYPTPAQRPHYSRLSTEKLARVHAVTLPDWRDALSVILDRLVGPASMRRDD
ncbi:dTDP-4-dehydrorhamnose reductase [Rhizobium alvei]|uniref:dTDP-4-dehydrorhamnose reductase n=1 Tax=Rhizobium alvei TaxID=1132659 RepID=A0ABT8YR33_9HYPH|nr:dTDP-4-dehydrorhamnose reductase [Rhizobium alvei]MDO6965620.1 dTDP-4-dehydrorhamnose reductase [Rhizobium alvei]